MPVPAGMRCKLVDSLRAAGEHLLILECAALLGERFRVSDLVECLEIDRLQLLQILRHLEQDLQLVVDMQGDEECFTFSSTFLLEIVRERLRVGDGGSTATGTPTKIARELHARITKVLERRKPRSPRALFRIAQHSYNAGSSQAEAAMKYCLEASSAARQVGDLSLAETYLAMADHSARRARKPLEPVENCRAMIAGKRKALETAGEHEEFRGSGAAENGHPRCQRKTES